MTTITLPPIPQVPADGAAPELWDRYLRILGFHLQADQIAVDGRMVEAQQALVSAWKSAESGDGARVVMAALMTEGGTDKPPAEVAQAVLARVAAVDTMLGGNVQPTGTQA